MDDADRAKIIEQREREAAIEAALSKVMQAPQHDRHGRRICLDCGDPIPMERLYAWPHAVRCVTCKLSWEQRQGRNR